MKVNLPNNRNIRIDQYVLQKLGTNILSVADVIRAQDLVMSNEDGAYILPHTLLCLLKLDFKISEKTNDQ